MNRRKRIVAALATASIVAAAGGIAVATWTASGSGSGQAKARSAVTVTVAAATGTADLYPGASGALYFTLNNTNPYPVTFTSLTPGTVTSSDPTNCPAANVSATSASGLSLPVGANATSPTLSVPATVSMAGAAGDGCQGVTFTVALTLSGSQS